MSLRALHLLFIIVAVATNFGFAWWCFATGSYVLLGACSAMIAAVLCFYGLYFFRKQWLLPNGAAR